jgi:excisionase family DNA binding protein
VRLTYRVAELAQLTGLSARSIHRLIAAGRWRTIREGRTVLVLAEDVAAWLEGRTVPPEVAEEARRLLVELA